MKQNTIDKILFVFLILSALNVGAQVHTESTPNTPDWVLKKLKPVQLSFNNSSFIKDTLPLPAGKTIKIDNETIKQNGLWHKVQNNLYVWNIAFVIPAAKSMNLYFEDFHLSETDKLFIFTKDKKQFLGAFTNKNNRKYFGTGLISGNELIIEFSSRKIKKLPFKIKEIGVVINSGKDFGNAGICEVPVNCPEGKNWKKQKSGVTRILVKDGTGLYWCTGSLINNTKKDGTPYILTANHCGRNATTANYAEWIFDFHYESADCNRPATEPQPVTFSGASLIARGETPGKGTASDFKLLLLDDTIPGEYQIYFNGWDRRNNIPQQGVTIHHPQGDIKFISTFDEAYSTYYYSSENPEAPFWKIFWKITESGHGVTEGGSSGAPLFNEQGLITGTLTGGDASCENTTAADYFGKFYKHWDKNGNTAEEQLKPWLDPENTGALTLNGFFKNHETLAADFYTNVNKITVGSFIKFHDNSNGIIKKYRWSFEGGEPASSHDKNPMVFYPNPGKYSVKLVVESMFESDSVVKENYINVTGNLYPNPFVKNVNDYIHILTGDTPANEININVFDINGKYEGKLNFIKKTNEIVFDPSTLASGIYIVYVTIHKTETPYKMVILN